MTATSSRRHGRATLSTLLLAFLFFINTSASAAVLGIDFGSQHLKAVLVKPGRPFDIVLTKDSKRKEVAAVAFKPTRDGSKIVAEPDAFPERLYGADAIALQGRFPSEVFPNLKPLLGISDSEEDQLRLATYKMRYPAVQLDKSGNDAVIRSTAFHSSTAPWTVEELLAMELANVKHNAESLAGRGSSCQDVVITVPVFYTAQEKLAIARAAELAGLNVMSLISDGLAVGLDYAKSRTFPAVNKGGKPEHHVVYDMGAGSTTATVLRFQGRDVKDIGRFNKTIQEVSVVGVGFDRYLGGDALTQMIMTDYVQKVAAKPAVKESGIRVEDIFTNGRAIGRLWKEADKARSVLSANTETFSSFEELLPDIDFKTKLSRTEFEALTEEFAERVTKPLEDALAAAKLKMADIDSIILHGGAVRTPFVQRKLEKLAGGAAKLKTNVNADESAVLGAALKAAILSPSFKVKEIRSSDSPGYASGLIHVDAGKQREQLLFNHASLVGNNATTKQISFKDKEDFSFQLFQDVEGDRRVFAEVATQNLTASVKALKEQFSCDKESVSTKLALRLNHEDGLIGAALLTVECETDKPVKSSVGDSVKDWLGLGKKKDTDSADDDAAGTTESVSATSSSSSSSKSVSSSKAPEKPKKRIETINVELKTTVLGQPSAETKKQSAERLLAFDRSDKARLSRDEAANVLESYTYYVKDFLTNSDYTPYSTAAQRDAISKLLATTREFMDQPGEVAKATEKIFREKLAGLKDLVNPIITRRTENEGYPEKLTALQSTIEQTNTFISMMGEQMQKAKDAASSSIAAASQSAASLAEKVVKPSGTDELDDLEEPVESQPAAAEDESSTLSDIITDYTEEELESIQKVYDDVKTWLTGKETEQKKAKLFEDPIFTIKELERQAALLSDSTMKLLQKKIKIPPRSSSKKAKTSKTKTKKGKSTATDNAESSVTSPASPEESVLNKAKFMTVEEGGEMPSEEQILKMIKDAKSVGSEKASASTRDEL